jgi:acetyl esterase/lipase
MMVLLLHSATARGESPATAPSYELKSNVLYRSGEELSPYMQERCRLDVYYPTGTKDFATLVFFHGGGLTGGDRFTPAELRDKGFAIVAVSYRLAPRVKASECIEDAAAAVAWTFKHIDDFGGDRARIFISGHSAGAYLTLMLGLDKRWLAAHQIDANDIAGLISLSSQTITHMQVRAERGIPATQPVVDELAPLYHLRKDAPPILLITGDRERELNGRYEENAYFWRMLKLAGHTRSHLIELDGFDHSQMSVPAYPLVIRFIRNGGSIEK